MSNAREVVEGTQTQGEDESIVYTIDASNIGDGPTSPVLVVKDTYDDYADVTEAVASGSASVSANVITLPKIHDLVSGKVYRCEIAFTIGGNDLEYYFHIEAKR